MRIRLFIFFCLLSSAVFSQSKKGSHKKHTQTPKKDIQQYYSAHQLTIDSARSPYLYYQVFDWVGTRYKYSGETKKGIDCSGFVSEMYKKVYCINLSGGSKDIYSQVKEKELTRAELKEGDILFFKIKKGQISHVGIYLGNNKFAHASVQSGVIISDLDEAYYKKYFFKGGRF